MEYTLSPTREWLLTATTFMLLLPRKKKRLEYALSSERVAYQVEGSEFNA